MRVLILSCNTGEGHNSCGKAIQKEFQKRHVSCDMEDAFRFISSGISSFVSYGFVRVYRHAPGLFRFGYQYSEQHPGVFKETSGIYKLLTSGVKRLYQFITNGNYDTILCTHVFSALIVTEILRRYNLPIRTYFVATDYTCSPSCSESDLNGYFIPAPSLADEFVACGIPREKLIFSGIPIRPEFFHSAEKISAKQQLGLSPDCRHLLVMCGSMGCGPIPKLVRLIAADLPKNCCVSVICGTNRGLYRKLKREHASHARIHIYQYVKDISTMMDSADLYLTKPGGISVTEAAHKRLPMVFVNAVAGCESHNMRFFVEKGAAITAETPEELAHLSLAFLTNEAALQQMADSFQEISVQSPAEQICEKLLSSQPS